MDSEMFCSKCFMSIAYIDTPWNEWIANWDLKDGTDGSIDYREPWFSACPNSPEQLMRFPTFGSAARWNDEHDTATGYIPDVLDHKHIPMDALSIMVKEARDARN